jgi:hypothetical protein
MAVKSSKPSESKTLAPPGSPQRASFRAPNRSPARRPWSSAAGPEGRRLPSPVDAAAEAGRRVSTSSSTWPRSGCSTSAYFARGGARSLEDFTAYEVKRYVVELQDRGLAPKSPWASTTACAWTS